MNSTSENFLMGFVKNNAWAIVIVTASVVAQWSIFSTRLTAIEQRQDRQGDSIQTIQNSLSDVQTQYAGLNAKLDGISDNVSYIRSRLDKTAGE